MKTAITLQSVDQIKKLLTLGVLSSNKACSKTYTDVSQPKVIAAATEIHEIMNLRSEEAPIWAISSNDSRNMANLHSKPHKKDRIGIIFSYDEKLALEADFAYYQRLLARELSIKPSVNYGKKNLVVIQKIQLDQCFGFWFYDSINSRKLIARKSFSKDSPRIKYSRIGNLSRYLEAINK